MKFFGQDKYGPVIVRYLQTYGPHTVREIAETVEVEIGLINKALRRMMCRGLVEETGQYRGDGIYRAKLYRWTDIEDVEALEPIMDKFERNVALEATDRAIRNLRAAYVPGMFDPFRVLRAQVAA